MDPFAAFVVFAVLWWMVFFMTLPFGVKTIENPGPGHASGAPERPRLVVKAAIATVIALALTAAAAATVEYDLIDFRGWMEAP